LYEMLTGRPPFLGESPWDTLQQSLDNDPVPPRRLQPRVPRDVEVICLKCLAKESPSRYPSASALADDLDRWLIGDPILARPAGVVERFLSWRRRNPMAAVLMAASVLLLATTLGVLGASTVLLQQANREIQD